MGSQVANFGFQGNCAHPFPNVGKGNFTYLGY
jgi:hypothetical protein